MINNNDDLNENTSHIHQSIDEQKHNKHKVFNNEDKLQVLLKFTVFCTINEINT